jgi:hypothetical protein
MKQFSNIHEILLLTTTSFSHRQLCERNDIEKKNHLSFDEELKDACWNGLLEEMLPEIFFNAHSSEKFFLWQVETGSSYLKLCMAAYPPVLNEYYSLDPHNFLNMLPLN